MSNTKITEGEMAPAEVVQIVSQLPNLWEKQAIKADQDGIRVRLVQLDTAIHANAVQCMLHAEKHGDTSLMRRLLVDIVDAKSGYRRQGIIAWMKEFSPMRLNGDIINLSGMDGDIRQAFRCEEANLVPFTQLKAADERLVQRPVFKDNLTSKIERALKEYRAAVDNTLIENAKVVGPKDVKKPFYDGIHLDKMDAGFDSIEKTLTEILSFSDSTKDARVARENLRKAELEVAANSGS